MRLSELIREGCKSTTQFFGEYFGGPGEACAMGAAMLASGMPIHELAMSPCALLPAACPFDCEELDVVPGGKCVRFVVAHLNDTHRWTREAIADWVQLQEAIAGIGQEDCNGPTGPCTHPDGLGHEGDHLRPRPGHTLTREEMREGWAKVKAEEEA